MSEYEAEKQSALFNESLTDGEFFSEAMKGLGEHDINYCRCNGNGWILSDFDTWESCRFHNSGQPHPEDYNEYN